MTDFNSTLLCREPFARHTAFTLWRLDPHPTEPETKPPIKVPVHFDGVTKHSTAHPAPPLTAELAMQWAVHHRANGESPAHDTPNQVGYLSVGFRPAGTGLVCVDMDDCIADGGWTPGALALMARFPGALIEQSTSGRGLHIWFTMTGEMPGRRGQVQTPIGKLEIYSEGQFIACGTVLAGDASIDHTAAAQALLAEFWPVAAPSKAAAPSDWSEKTPEQQAVTLAELRSALAAGWDPDNRDDWQRAGHALSTLDEDGYRLWAEWSATSKVFPGGAGLDKWDGFRAERTDYRSVFAQAQRGGWVNPAQRPALPGDASAVFAAATDAHAGLPAGAVLTPPPGRAVAAAAGLSFMAAAGGAIAATVANIEEALMSPEANIAIAYDAFLDQRSISIGGEPPRAFEDEDYGDLRARLERRGFKPVSAEVMKTVVGMVARRNKFDSAVDWIESLVWDGVPRISRAMQAYYGCEDTPYASAVGEYLFTGLAGRCTTPGIKADMSLILVGLQGARKTSAVEALCPTPEAFGEIDLNKSDDALARSMRGKLVVELAELKGLSGRDAESVKAWFSRRFEEWRPVYREALLRYGRRSMTIGTDNNGEFLDDPSGARRFLPIQVGLNVDIEGLLRDRDQLWAEGLARFRQSGIAWKAAEQLAKNEHAKFETVDENLAFVSAWLATPPPPLLGHPLVTTSRGSGPVRGGDILTGALNYQPSNIKKGDQMMLAKIMRRLGYVRTTIRQHGEPIKVWVTAPKPPQ